MQKRINIGISVSVYLLTIIGIIFIYSASCYSALNDFNDAFYYVKKQCIAFVFAIAAKFIGRKTNLELLRTNNIFIYVFSCLLLAMVFIPGLGIEKYGATRWLNFGITTFQPSELAKFSLVLTVASILAKESVTTFRSLAKVLIVTAIIAVLIMIEPNMSITMCVVLVVFFMLIAGGIKVKFLIILLIPLIIGIVALIILEPYRLKRLLAFIDPWKNPLGEGYQLIQSYYALSSGKIFGLGIFNSRQKYLFLPFAESDFIFSIIGEETGLIGCFIVLMLFVFIAYNGFKIAYYSHNRFNSYFALGITSVIIIQAIINIAVVTGSIPPTGLPMPFVSSGGSSLLVIYYFIGVLENISNSREPRIIHKML